jgi:hypothetical protein
MGSFVRLTTEQRLLEYVYRARLSEPDDVPIFELTTLVVDAIDRELSETLTAALRELGRRGGLVVSIEPSAQMVARGRLPAHMNGS